MLSRLNHLAWLFCIVYATIPCYWLLVHPFAARWRNSHRSPYLILLPAWIAMWASVAVLTWSWRERSLYAVEWSWLPGLCLIGAGLRLYWASRQSFDRGMLAGHPELRPASAQRLVTAGIRARIRHPIYAGHLCELLGWSVASGLGVCYLLTMFAILTGALMIRLEDAELERRFGQPFREYRARVPALLPRWR